MIKLIIGLGNPGPEYKNTYHNAGFLFVDYLKKKTDGSYSLLATRYSLKSSVYMNESGSFVKKALKKSGAKLAELLLAHDDSDLGVGEYKLSFDRGAAGHKGVQSVIESLGTKKFWRLRIGVRPDKEHEARSMKQVARLTKAGLPAETRRAQAGEFVLKKIKKEDKEKMIKAIQNALKEIDLNGFNHPESR